jgi:hypothetical protein
MKTLYEAANAIEAHMLLDLVKQEGIEAQIQGEALQGAMGEVPMNGLVRLVVPDEHYDAARTVIDRWERTEVPAPLPKPPSRSAGVRMLLLGLVIGVGGTYAAYRAPVTTDGIDHDHDGVLDEKWTYSPNGMPLKMEADRNFDHKTDYIAHYDQRGLIESAESDDNFDGVFETKQGYRNNNVEVVETDTDGDGYADLRTRYAHGVVDTVEYINPTSGHPLRVEQYKLGVLQFADVDTDKDGKVDTRIRYTPLAEVASREPLPK